ncbi:SDR family NAD(P)-dependent oxidoreductase [uncultured Bacteroides sp.]|uniref:SDR family NAD(P)-dependent oxidoreductase n=1 Tax=uncultured Bacteroides sp. TaxID=162156 RepID=UPI00280A6D21|nr:SDR family NAD(P)-dependent oxidoreductase [uncultured Bacteroides sp.]
MKKKPIQRALIVGATSGIGKETALQLLQKGWILGLAGRREEKLKELQQLAPDRIHIRAIDICQAEAPDRLQELIEEMGGMDLYLHCSGIGHQNYALAPDIELQTLETNGTGFVRMVTAAFRYFARQQGGHLAVISSIAGTKGLGAAPAYSATKRFQNIYIDSLEQLAYMQHLPIRFTDIRPGFVATGLLNDGKHYPMLMSTEKVARHIVRALEKKKRIALIDWRYRIMVALWHLIPPFIWKQLPIRN